MTKEKSTAKPRELSLTKLFQQGDSEVKISYFLMGWANLVNGQIVKGLWFLLVEVAFFFWLFVQGLPSIGMLRTLGTKKQGWVLDEKQGINVLQAGDNSMLLLLFGIAALIVVGLFLYQYRVNLKSTRDLYLRKLAGKKPLTLKETWADLLDKKLHILLMSIPLVGVLIFTVLPLLYMLSIAFTSYDHNHLPPKNLFSWVGFHNFGNVLNGDIAGTFFPVLGWTLTWAVLATVTSFIFGVLLAMMINAKGIGGKKIYRTLFILTMAMPQFISLLIMSNLFADAGLVNATLMNWGWISHPLPFLSDGLWAKFTIVFVNLWVGIPATMLVTTGILQNLSQDQVEAAEIDGANKFQIFRDITFPQILFVMAPSLIQQFIGNINNFNVIFLLTNGGPSNSNYYNAGDTDLLVTWLYKLTVDAADYNLASVIGILIFVLSAVFSLLAYKRVNKLGAVN